MEFKHIPVLLNESIDGLNIQENGIYVDCTVGGAGHSSEILKRIKSNGHLYGFDQDAVAIETAQAKLSRISPRFTLIHTNFRNMKGELKVRGITKVNGILFDLGVSSYQFDNGERGFSYNHNAVLDMRMDKRQDFNAYTLVNTWSEKDISDILFKYGEEKFAKQIARKIIDFRKNKPLTTTFELVDIIKSAIPASKRKDGGHPAKRTFQALRVAVNDELNVLRNALEDALELLDTNGRICVITFQSLEDRIVKEIFKEVSNGPSWKRGMPINLNEEKAKYRLITKHPIVADEDELDKNNRSHSAKLRIIERI